MMQSFIDGMIAAMLTILLLTMIMWVLVVVAYHHQERRRIRDKLRWHYDGEEYEA
jgi:CHASE1-domain containing sensor protein